MPKTWNDIIENLDAKQFIGREKEISMFLRNIDEKRIRNLIFYISGQGGVGKTSLLKRYKEEAEDFGCVVAESDEQEGSIPAILFRFSSDLEKRGHPLHNFSKKYSKYLQLKQDVESDPNAPEGMAAFLGQGIVRAGFAFGDDVPILKQGLKLVDQDSISTQAGEWAKYLSKKMSNKHDEIALLKNPSDTLTKSFFEDLNESFEKKIVLLCFDNFEITRNYLDAWLNSLRDYDPTINLRLLVAGRSLPGPKWEKLKNVTTHIRLDVFSEEEANVFLNLAEIENLRRRDEIIKFSGRLPVLMSWLASPENKSPDTALETGEIVDRFLRWVKSPSLKEIALDAALLNFFNLDVVEVISDKNNFEEKFEWLRKQPFISQREKGWEYHDVVRKLIVHYHKQRSQNRFQDIHNRIANYYDLLIKDMDLGDVANWASQSWIDLNIQYVYHQLMSNPAKNWHIFINWFVLSFQNQMLSTGKIIELLTKPSNLALFEHEQQQVINFLFEKLSKLFEDIADAKDEIIVSDGVQELIIHKNEPWVGFDLFEYLCELPYLELTLKSHLLEIQGEAYRMIGKPDKALECLNKALEYDKNSSTAFTVRGEIFRSQEKFDDAFEDFDRSLAIRENHWTYDRKGFALFQCESYQKAIKTLNLAIETGPSCYKSLSYRGACYLKLGQITKALEDLNYSLELFPESPYTLIRRGEALIENSEYELAIVDFENAMSMEGDWEKPIHECEKNIGIALFELEKYDDALSRFIASLNSTPSCSHCWQKYIQTVEKLNSRKDVPEIVSNNNIPGIKFSPSVFVTRANGFLFEKYYLSALKDIKLAQKGNPDFDISTEIDCNDLGLGLSRAGNYKQAVESFELDNDTASFVNKYNIAIAKVLWKGPDASASYLEDAKKEFEVLLKHEPDMHDTALYGFAGLELAKGNTNEAINRLKRIAKKDSEIVGWLGTDPIWKKLEKNMFFQKLKSDLT